MREQVARAGCVRTPASDPLLFSIRCPFRSRSRLERAEVDLAEAWGDSKEIRHEDAALLISLNPVCSLLRPVRRDLSMIRQDGRYGFRLLRVTWN